MEPYWQDNCRTIYCKDCRDMSELPGESVQCVVTSPPYFGLRKYAGNQEMVWGDNHCEHEWLHYKRPAGGGHPSVSAQVGATKADVQRIYDGVSNWCSLCGAWKGALGLEPTPEMYVSHIVEIFREVRRVLRKDGVAFLNIGDSYCGSNCGYGDYRGNKSSISIPQIYSSIKKPQAKVGKPKDLCLIPFRLAIALQEDGWWVRSVIHWVKTNPMPESVTDRPTDAVEYILMLTKSGTTQYWTHRDKGGQRTQPEPDYRWTHRETKEEVSMMPEGWTPKNKMDWDRVNLWSGHDYYWDADAVRESPKLEYAGQSVSLAPEREGVLRRDGGRSFNLDGLKGRNIRNAWIMPTKPFPGAHFAVFPEEMPRKCILAATSEKGNCSECGAPWVRVVDNPVPVIGEDIPEVKRAAPYQRDSATSALRVSGAEWQEWRDEHPRTTLGWQPTCTCNAPVVPAIVLDPFSGAGTTLLVAAKLGRMAVGYDLSEEYCRLAVKRNSQGIVL